jgi:hypothetical protein
MAWELSASPTCLLNGPASTRCLGFPATRLMATGANPRELPANVEGEAARKAFDKLIRVGLLEEIRAPSA